MVMVAFWGLVSDGGRHLGNQEKEKKTRKKRNSWPKGKSKEYSMTGGPFNWGGAKIVVVVVVV